ncbi:MAG: GntR family transcriptional regulator [Beutenbergiaceae bacterium]
MKKYESIAKDLSTLIDSKRPGDKIPTEQELAASYGASPMTVRRALQLLISAGRIEGIPGRGTFVRAPQMTRALASTSFSETMRAAGRTPSSTLIAATLSAATQAEALTLELEADHKVIRIQRIRYGDDIPMCVEKATLPAHRFPGLLGHNLEQSLYALLRSKYSTNVTWSRFDVAATIPDAETAARLGIERRTPCLQTENISRDEAGAMIEHTTSLYRGDIYHLTLETGEPGSRR